MTNEYEFTDAVVKFTNFTFPFGKLYLKDNKWEFEGDLEDSALVFMQYLCNKMNAPTGSVNLRFNKYNVSINNCDNNWVQVTISGKNAGLITEKQIAVALNAYLDE